MNIALAPNEPLLRRVGKVIQAHPRVDSVGYWAESTRQADIYVVIEAGDEAAIAASRGAQVVSAGRQTVPGLHRASLDGLADALAEAVGSTVARLATALPGGRSGRIKVDYPSPIGRRYAVRSDDGVLQARSGHVLAAAVIDLADGGRLAVLDEPDFLAAACLAAGVLAMPDRDGRVVEPKDVAVAYLEAITWLGVVVAEAAG